MTTLLLKSMKNRWVIEAEAPQPLVKVITQLQKLDLKFRVVADIVIIDADFVQEKE